MIQLRFLSKNNIGEWVIYRDKGSDKTERGRIKSWNSEYIFVVYGQASQQRNWQDYTGLSTDPADLTFENAATDQG
jgi:hypothetical protein